MNNNGQHAIATNAPFSLARRTRTDRPAARSRKPILPARSSLRPGGRGTKSSKQTEESRGEGVGRRREEGRRWVRPSSSFISSASSHLLFRLVVFRRSSSHHLIRSSHPRRRPRSSRRRRSSSQRAPFSPARCSLFLFSSSRRLPSWLVSSSHPSSHPRRYLICRLAVSCAVSLARRSSFRPSSRSSFRCRLVPRSARRLVPHPSARHRSPFHRQGRAGRFSHSIARWAGQASRGRGGAWDSEGHGVHAMGGSG